MEVTSNILEWSRALKYRIISVGKIREPFYQAGVQEYLKRLTPYAAMELVEGLEEKLSPRAGDKDIARALDKEGDKILNLISDNEILIAMDINGRQLSSEGPGRDHAAMEPFRQIPGQLRHRLILRNFPRRQTTCRPAHITLPHDFSAPDDRNDSY